MSRFVNKKYKRPAIALNLHSFHHLECALCFYLIQNKKEKKPLQLYLCGTCYAWTLFLHFVRSERKPTAVKQRKRKRTRSSLTKVHKLQSSSWDIVILCRVLNFTMPPAPNGWSLKTISWRMQGVWGRVLLIPRCSDVTLSDGRRRGLTSNYILHPPLWPEAPLISPFREEEEEVVGGRQWG